MFGCYEVENIMREMKDEMRWESTTCLNHGEKNVLEQNSRDSINGKKIGTRDWRSMGSLYLGV